jgi:CBS domain-containing protein
MKQKKSANPGEETSQEEKSTKREKSQPRSRQNGATAGHSTRKQSKGNTHASPQPVGKVMTRAVVFIHPDDSIKDAATKMKDLDVGLLPVCEGDRVVGLLTDRDITIRGIAAGLNPEGTRIREVMSSGAISCFEDEDVSEAARIMRDKQVRRLVVLNRDNRLAGLVSLGDIAVGTGDAQMSGDALQGVSQPSRPRS